MTGSEFFECVLILPAMLTRKNHRGVPANSEKPQICPGSFCGVPESAGKHSVASRQRAVIFAGYTVA